jgi:hypothetical protein
MHFSTFGVDMFIQVTLAYGQCIFTYCVVAPSPNPTSRLSIGDTMRSIRLLRRILQAYMILHPPLPIDPHSRANRANTWPGYI